VSEGLYRRNFASPRRERAFLGAVGFTATFVTVRVITLSIRAGIGPFGNISAGGRRIHHSTFGIIGLLACGYVWTYQWDSGQARAAAGHRGSARPRAEWRRR
jgi:hypothetical protein